MGGDGTAPMVAFRLLGPVAAVGPGGELSLGPPRRYALLAALLLDAGVPVPVARLVDLLWDGDPPATAATMVHGAVAGLRRVLGPEMLATAPGGYALRVAPERVDALRFEQLLAAGRRDVATSPDRAATVLAQALDLWRGPALAGVEAGFARDAAGRLDGLRVDCAELRAEAALAAGRPGDVVAELQELVTAHPLRERCATLLMRALHAAGRSADALAGYRRLRRDLVAELGVEPGPDARRAEAEILAPPPAPARRTTRLPVPPDEFVGREADRAELTAQLAAHRLVTLTGTGGAGKTRLALEVAPTGAILVDLLPVRSPATVEETLAAALGVRPEPGVPLGATIATALADRDTVVVLDNCEHLAEACAALVRALLAGCPRVRVLATSREPLGVPGERVHPVAPLPLADPGAPWPRIAGCEAVTLFATRAAAVRPGFAVDASNAALVLDVCRRLDGLPLALELAAARVASMPLPDLATRLGDRFRLLDAGVRGGDPRHRTLAATVAWSHDLLGADERTLFARLGVFPADFDLAAVEALAAAPPALPSGDVALLLSRLAAGSTVVLDDGPPARYRLLETTRGFARSRLREADLAGLRARHAHHYAALAADIAPNLFRAGSAPWLARLDAEVVNLRAALEWAFAAGDPAASRLGARVVGCLWHHWDLRGARAEGLRWVHTALADPAVTDAPDRLPLLSAGALLHLGRAEFDATAALAGTQLDLARAAGEQGWEGDALGMAATVAWARGAYDRAQQLYEDAVAASLAGGDVWRAAMEEAQLARLHRDRDEPDAAHAAAGRAAAHADAVGEELARGLALDVRASLEHRWGDVARARGLVDRALEHYRCVDYREGEASALHLSGRLALAAAELGAARAAFERSLRLCREIGHRAGIAAAHDGLVDVGEACGRAGAAARRRSEAAAVRLEIGVPAHG